MPPEISSEADHAENMLTPAKESKYFRDRGGL